MNRSRHHADATYDRPNRANKEHRTKNKEITRITICSLFFVLCSECSDPGQFAEHFVIAIAHAARPLAQLRAGRPSQQHLALGEDKLDHLDVVALGGAQPTL